MVWMRIAAALHCDPKGIALQGCDFSIRFSTRQFSSDVVARLGDPVFRGMTAERYESAFSRRDAPELCVSCAPLVTEGAGNAGCPMHPQARVRCRMAESTRGNHGHTGITRHSPRNGFTAYNALSSATGLSCHRRPRSLANLTPASGCQDHTSLPYAATLLRQKASPGMASFVSTCVPDTAASTASRPAFATIMIRPLSGTGRSRYTGDLGQRRSGILPVGLICRRCKGSGRSAATTRNSLGRIVLARWLTTRIVKLRLLKIYCVLNSVIVLTPPISAAENVTLSPACNVSNDKPSCALNSSAAPPLFAPTVPSCAR